MNQIKKILKEETDKRDMLKDRMKQQLTAGGTFNLGKVVKTFGVNHPILEEAVIEWANEGLQRMKTITPTSKARAAFIKMFDDIYPDVWFEKYPESLFFFKGSPTKPEYWFELENLSFWCDYEKVWFDFLKKYPTEYGDIQQFIKSEVEKAFGLKGVTSKVLASNDGRLVEEAFRLKNQ